MVLSERVHAMVISIRLWLAFCSGTLSAVLRLLCSPTAVPPTVLSHRSSLCALTLQISPAAVGRAHLKLHHTHMTKKWKGTDEQLQLVQEPPLEVLQFTMYLGFHVKNN